MTSVRDLFDLGGRVALVTGGSRGLGLLTARELARAGCRVAICARDPEELERARAFLAREGAEALALTCDVTDREQVERTVAAVSADLGPIDLLVANAGIVSVAPARALTVADFEAAMATIFWGTVYPVMVVLPDMRARRAGRITIVTSIGGKVAVPHLLPYSSAKFAATGFAQGLRAEAARDGITVTTIVPGLMRTGSPVNARFGGQVEAEFAWFALADSLPLLSMDAERAAAQVVEATRRGEAERVLTLPAALAARLHGLMPGVTADLLGLVNRLLPDAEPTDHGRVRGETARRWLASPLLDTLIGWTLSAARRYNQYPARAAERDGEAGRRPPAGRPDLAPLAD
jgi:NAD(P)-dependent dehydrogenase (short-subunit alcohol dehydrogenase family)